MKLHLASTAGINTISGYGDHHVIVADRAHRASLIITPSSIRTDWAPTSLTALTRVHLEAVLELKPEVVLLGTGHRLGFPAVEITAPLIDHGVGLEVMDTAAACRTYNILASEGRNIAAALIIEAAATP